MPSVWKRGASKIATERKREYRWSIFQHISATIELSEKMNNDDVLKKNKTIKYFVLPALTNLHSSLNAR